MKFNSIKSNIKIYIKILLFVCIFWLGGAFCFYHISFCHTYGHAAIILDQRISQPMYYVLCSKESLKQTVWLPIMLFPCAIFLFHWKNGRGKTENTITETFEVTELKTNEAKQKKEILDIGKTMEGNSCKRKRKKNA